ncbi:MAG: hypothetical protein QGF72_02090 [Candidatus Poseidoniaceae archaeon]|nr:hypothetical protein [Candidatus Poseidoniaceae archaeon]
MGTTHATLNITDEAKKTTVSAGSDSIIATAKQLEHGSSKTKVKDILGLHTDGKGASGPGYGIFLETESGDSEIIRCSSENEILRAMETLAAMLQVRLDEHTGRSVEADEHGMNVVDQIYNFPERWPAVPNMDLQMVKFVTIGSIVCFTIPSRIRDGTKWTFWSVSVLGLLLGIPISAEAPGESQLLWWLFFLLPLLAILGICIMITMKNGMFESKHDVRLTKEKIHVIPKFMGIVSMPSRSWPMADFRDLDVAEGGRLTLLMGDERLYCDMDQLEAEWVMAEIVERLERFGLANRAETANASEEE